MHGIPASIDGHTDVGLIRTNPIVRFFMIVVGLHTDFDDISRYAKSVRAVLVVVVVDVNDDWSVDSSLFDVSSFSSLDNFTLFIERLLFLKEFDDEEKDEGFAAFFVAVETSLFVPILFKFWDVGLLLLLVNFSVSKK